MEKKQVKVGITHGDTNGIGYEIILKTLADERLMELCTPVVYGSVKVAQHHSRKMELDTVPFTVIDDAAAISAGKPNLINCVTNDINVEFGVLSHVAGNAALQSLEAAVADLKAGHIDVLLTAPINKHAMQSAGFKYPGHTEYLEQQLSEHTPHKSLMMLVCEHLRIAPLTGHAPLNEVAERITIPRILDKLTLFDAELVRNFTIRKPRIAVLSLNPHAGDHGLLGSEEDEVIIPAIAEAERLNLLVFGPYAADGFFGSGLYRKFDGVLAMYHDQGLIPFKMIAADEGVNFTAGLSAIRTSPAHGTAFDIAGQGIASENSFRKALFMALDLHKYREMYREMTENPLRKQFVDKNDLNNNNGSKRDPSVRPAADE
jgi:4-hydroxythreonine-4-phosphate dehydrogenase